MPTASVQQPQGVLLGSMNGTWILDKRRGSPSMRGYLETMGVTELAIEGGCVYFVLTDFCINLVDISKYVHLMFPIHPDVRSTREGGE